MVEAAAIATALLTPDVTKSTTLVPGTARVSEVDPVVAPHDPDISIDTGDEHHALGESRHPQKEPQPR